MKTELIIEHINNRDLDKFYSLWKEVNKDFAEEDKQELLTDIIDDFYSENEYLFFTKIFDQIIDSKLDLNFQIDHFAPTFLTLVILNAPSIELFDYFVNKGADINYVGDTFAFYTEKEIEEEKELQLFPQYQTCLDFIEICIEDLEMYINMPALTQEVEELLKDKETITIKGNASQNNDSEFYKEPNYTEDLAKTEELKEHIIKLGGKRYEELSPIGTA